jgi:HAD superfamily hydrolase (TIGR01662 family)
VDDWVSLRVQRGNADDVLMHRLHGRRWRENAQIPRGRFPWHLATTAAALTAAAAAATGHRRTALVQGGLWAVLTGDFTLRRIIPGPRPGTPPFPAEARRMLITSLLIPPAAVWHRLRGLIIHRRHAVAPWPLPVRAILFDRDGTLVHDVPYNGDPARVEPMADAAAVLAVARAHGLATAVVTNQSGLARGWLTREQVDAVNAKIDSVLGPFDNWQVCPHGMDDNCQCRKPRPGMILAAARELGLRPQECVVMGDIGADIEAARAAGARAVLVPTATTRAEEVAAAPFVAEDLRHALALVLGPDRARLP